MVTKANFRSSLLAAACISTFAGTGVRAEEAADTAKAESVDAIVVTARRRAEILTEVPATVSVVDGTMLRDQGISNIREIVGLVPNAVIQDSANGLNTFINIRGVREAGRLQEVTVVLKLLPLVALIGIILLMGIVKKNAIMMIDFALAAEREDGLSPAQAMRRAAVEHSTLQTYQPQQEATLPAWMTSA